MPSPKPWSYNDGPFGLSHFPKWKFVRANDRAKILTKIDYTILQDMLWDGIKEITSSHHILLHMPRIIRNIFLENNLSIQNSWWSDNVFIFKYNNIDYKITKSKIKPSANSIDRYSHEYIFSYTSNWEQKEYKYKSTNIENPYIILKQIIEINTIIDNPTEQKTEYNFSIKEYLTKLFDSMLLSKARNIYRPELWKVLN